MAYSPSAPVSVETLLRDLLSISLTAVNHLRPLYDPASELIDFATEYFNPATQRMTGVHSERPADTLPVEVQQQLLIAPLLNLLDGTVARFRLTIEQLTELIRLQQSPAGAAQLVPLGPLVSAIQQVLVVEIAVAQAQVEVVIPEGLGVHFALANLRSIVYNLLSNALKYRDPARPARVTVRAERQSTATVLTVQDNGLGSSKSQLERLFQACQRLHTHVEGTGVGLYLIQRLLNTAGGTITVASTPGVASTFTVTLPLLAEGSSSLPNPG